jgi:hypothetical protein
MGHTACTEPQCLYKRALCFTLLYFIKGQNSDANIWRATLGLYSDTSLIFTFVGLKYSFFIVAANSFYRGPIREHQRYYLVYYIPTVATAFKTMRQSCCRAGVSSSNRRRSSSKYYGGLNIFFQP